MRLSIIVPALNEAAAIPATLVPLQPLRGKTAEIIVADGGSNDATIEIAHPLADRILVAPRGRAAQMNAGALAACGDVLLFLHADSMLERAPVATMLDQLGASDRRWGRFDVAIDGQAGLLRLVAALMNLRSRLTGIATGDQGIFVERALFDRIGGYPALPLMEDIALSRSLKRAAGPPLCLSARIVTSGRRWDKHGPWRTMLRMWRLRLLFYCGADPARLARAYDAGR